MNNNLELKELFVREDGVIEEITDTVNEFSYTTSHPENYYG